MSAELIRNVTLITMDDEGSLVEDGLVLIVDGKIAAVGSRTAPIELPPDTLETDGGGKWLLPGFVQPHLHLCQTLFRGLGEDMTLMDWLRQRLWPLEAGHDASTLAASARLGVYELLSGGATAIMDMGAVHDVDVLFDVARETGIRATFGKSLMTVGQGMPRRLRQDPETALKESVDLANRFHLTENERLRFAFSPRFLLSVSGDTLRKCAIEARRLGCNLQTHVAENAEETLAVLERTGLEPLRFLESVDCLGPDVAVAHAIHLTVGEFNLLKSSRTHVVHCPSANMKLGSGSAKAPEFLASGINVGLSSDGAPCNNNISIFKEMRLAGLLQSLRRGPKSLPAMQIVYMATRGGAAAMGLQESIGSIEEGKRADLVMLDPFQVHCSGSYTDPYTRLVYSMDERNVHTVWVDGKKLYRKGHGVAGMDARHLLEEADAALDQVLARIPDITFA